MKKSLNNYSEKITTESTYNGMPINTNKDKEQGCFTKILDKIQAHREDMINKHSKVLQARIDLHYPQDGSVTPNPQHLEDFHNNFKRKLNRKKISGGHKVDPRFITVQELHSSAHPHFHSVILTNGNAIKDYYTLAKEAERQWKQAIKTDQEGLVNYCNKHKNGILIDRNAQNFEENKQQAFYQASYLSKVRGKQDNPKGSWLVKGTRNPKK